MQVCVSWNTENSAEEDAPKASTSMDTTCPVSKTHKLWPFVFSHAWLYSKEKVCVLSTLGRTTSIGGGEGKERKLRKWRGRVDANLGEVYESSEQLKTVHVHYSATLHT